MDNGTLLAVKFKDHSVFQMLSSVHSVADVEVGQNHPSSTGRTLGPVEQPTTGKAFPRNLKGHK